MTDVKFARAKFFDPSLTHKPIYITPSEYDESEHHGRIECPEDGCHASLSYVPSFSSDGDNIQTDQHFKTNPHGEDHKALCPLTPEGHQFVKDQARMSTALEEGSPIRINVNFLTSYDRTKAKKSRAVAKEDMPKIGGLCTQDWRSANAGYAYFAASNATRLRTLIGSYSKALEETGIEPESPLSFAHLHGVVPWTTFLLDDGRRGQVDRSHHLHERDIFQVLFADLHDNPMQPFSWSSAPALRRRMSLHDYSRSNGGPILFTNQRHVVSVEGQHFEVQDVVETSRLSPEVQERLKTSGSFSFVATPYIGRRQLSGALEATDTSRKPIHMKWPLTNENQIIFEG